MKKAGQMTLISALLFAAFLFPTLLAAQETPKFLYGVASWYGDGFEGKPTASGEPFAMNGLTAAHKTFPFGTRLEVENLGNGKKVEVRVNDRGPFVENRILDISKQAAEILDFINEGKTFVKITVLEMGDPLSKPVGTAVPAAPKQEIPQGYQAPAAPAAPIAPAAPVTAPAAPAEIPAAPAPEMDEADFMNDGIPPAANTEAPLRTQQIPPAPDAPFGENAPNIYGFSSNTQPAPITDPLNGQDPALPDTIDPVTNLTPQEEYTVYPGDDTFGDLFSDTNEPKDFFPPNMNGNKGNQAQNIGGDYVRPAAPPPAPARLVPAIPAAPAAPAAPLAPAEGYSPVQPAPMPAAPVQETPYTPAPVVRPSQVGGWVVNPPVPAAAPNGYYIIQVGAFSQSENAMKIYNALKKAPDFALNNVYTADINTKVKGRNQNVMRVRIGFFLDETTALEKAAMIDSSYKNMGIKSSVIKVDFLP